MENRYRLELRGCAPIPLAAYLKGLAVLRLVSEQCAAAQPRGWWANECFVLESTLDRDGLIGFFSRQYIPTPIVAPWNGGSGFFAGDNQSGIEPLESAKSSRFAGYASVIRQVREVLDGRGLTVKPDGEQKAALLLALRAVLPDLALDWLDAAVVLTSDQPRYPPLLGTGGNDGRLDFTNNFMQRLALLFDLDKGDPIDDALPWLRSALFGDAVPGMLKKSAIGQFAPGAAGGPNAQTGFTSDSLTNPWDFVLMLEGALLFAAAASRRLDGGSGGMSYPFTVRVTGAGSGSTALSDEGGARAEMWLPLWERPATLRELKVLLGEGRATLGSRTARDGLDFARAVAKVGVHRGIHEFQRYAFLMRSGKAYLATPLNRFHVVRNPRAELVDELEGWLSRFRESGRRGSNQTKALAHQLDDALFTTLTSVGNGVAHALQVQKLLSLLGTIQRHLASGKRLREECPPIPLLSHRWVTQADDRSPEFRLAAALASISSEPLPARAYLLPDVPQRPQGLNIAAHIAPVHPRDPGRWFEPSRLVAWGEGSLFDNLSRVLQRRLIEADRLGFADKPLAGGTPADLSAIGDLLAGAVDERRVNSLIPGLALCQSPRYLPWRHPSARPLPLPYLLLKLLFVPNETLRAQGVLQQDGKLPLPAAIPRLLQSGRVADAVREGVRRRRGSGVNTPPVDMTPFSVDGRRLLAALMVPVEGKVAGALFGKINDLRPCGRQEVIGKHG